MIGQKKSLKMRWLKEQVDEMDYDYTRYKSATDMLNKTGFSVKVCLELVEAEIRKLEGK